MIRELTPRQLHDALQSAVPPLLIDIREPEEHAFVHLPSDRLVPLMSLELEWPRIRAEADQSGKSIVFYCRSGCRSAMVLDWLRNRGEKSVAHLAGGILAYSDEIDPSLPKY